MISEATQAKADRLLAAGRVDPIDGELRRFRVDGHTGTYDVIVGGSFRCCSCPATTDCSHIVAAIRWWLSEIEATKYLRSLPHSDNAPTPTRTPGYLQFLAYCDARTERAAALEAERSS